MPASLQLIIEDILCKPANFSFLKFAKSMTDFFREWGKRKLKAERFCWIFV